MDLQDDESARARDDLALIAKGDRTAFDRFFLAHERRVYRFALRLVGDPDLARDVTSDVMVEVWKSAGRFADRAKPSTWLLGIAHHKGVDRLRARRTNVVDLHAIAEPAAASGDEPESRAIDACTRAEIEAAMATLSPEHRAVIHLAFVLGHAQHEIASITGVPLGTVKTRVFHAKRALRRRLSETMQERKIS